MIAIVKKCWDFFFKKGAKHTILVYKFSVDTGNTKPVCCKNPQYGPYKSNITMEKVQALIRNVWIEKCGGTWSSSIVLAAKPHQEHIKNIDYFIWRMCVSYRKINGITKIFRSPIPCCSDAIVTASSGSNKSCILSLYVRQGFHQILVCHVNR